MKRVMRRVMDLITMLVALCMVLAVASFFLPGVYGLVLSYVTIGIAVLVALISLAALAVWLQQGRRSAV